MHRSRRSVVIGTIALAGVLGMAGVAAAARGRRFDAEAGRQSHCGDKRGCNRRTTADTPARVTTATQAERPRPEPGDDNGVDPAGHDANDDHGNDATVTSPTIADTSTSVPDDHGVEPAGHDANDDHGNRQHVDVASRKQHAHHAHNCRHLDTERHAIVRRRRWHGHRRRRERRALARRARHPAPATPSTRAKPGRIGWKSSSATTTLTHACRSASTVVAFASRPRDN